jgi:hypothetical protein
LRRRHRRHLPLRRRHRRLHYLLNRNTAMGANMRPP